MGGGHSLYINGRGYKYNNKDGYILQLDIRVITKLPNSEQTYKGKVKTHKYINRQISQQLENCENRNDPDLVQAFLKK